MRILPVNFNNYNPVYNTKTQKSTMTPVFNGQDTFKSGSVLDMEISNIKEGIKNTVDPYKDKYNEKFIQAGKIGYESQEKLKLAKEYHQTLWNKRFNAGNNAVFKKVEKTTDLYEKFSQNVNNFERTAEFIQSREIYSTHDLLNAIDKYRPKVYKDKEEFEKIKPLYDKYQAAKTKTDEDLEALIMHENPEFRTKMQKLDEQNKEAVFIFLTSGYMEMQNIYKGAKTLFADYEQKKYPQYELLQRAEKINEDIARFKETIQNSDETQKNIDDFIQRNHDYEKNPLTKEEIKQEYETRLNKADKIIQKHAGELEEYYTNNPVKLSPRIVSRALNAQNKANNTINQLLQNEKEKQYNK